MAKKVEHVIETKKDRRFLSCQLTSEELTAAADAMAQGLDDREALEGELATIKAQYKGKLEQCEANINAKKRLVRDKREIRPVEVEIVTDLTDCTLQVTRLDTSEIIEDRPLTGDEKQLKITFEDKDGDSDS